MNTNSIQRAAQPVLQIVNNLNSSKVNVYMTGLDANNRLVIFQSDGTFVRPTVPSGSGAQPIPFDMATPLGGLGSTTSIRLSEYISSGRIWVADGKLQFRTVAGANGSASLIEPSVINSEDPNASVNWGFVEISNTPSRYRIEFWKWGKY
jgi:hypothetical protein